MAAGAAATSILPPTTAGGPAAGTPGPTPPQTYPYGSAAYYVPGQMVEKQAVFVDLWIDRTMPAQKLQEALAAHLKQTMDQIKSRLPKNSPGQKDVLSAGDIDTRNVPVGDKMIAQLRGGDDFDVDPKEPVSQSLEGESWAKWNWRVTPKIASDAGLLLSLDVWIDPGSGRHLIDSFHEKVIVKARQRTLYEIFQEIDKWLILLGAGGLAGIFTAAWKWLKSRGEKT